jgi:hypothetical protein
VIHSSEGVSPSRDGFSELAFGAWELRSSPWTDSNNVAVNSNHPPTPGSHRAKEMDLAVGKGGVHPDEESIEEIFSQLWVVPKSERARVGES